MTNKKPEELIHPNVCPQKLCFHWRSEGDYIAPGLYENLDEDMVNKKLVEKDTNRKWKKKVKTFL